MIRRRRAAWGVVRATIDAALVLALVVSVLLVVRGEPASGPVSAGTRQPPQQQSAGSTPPPSVNVTHALGWPGGGALPTAAGLRVAHDGFNAGWRVNAAHKP